MRSLTTSFGFCGVIGLAASAGSFAACDPTSSRLPGPGQLRQRWGEWRRQRRRWQRPAAVAVDGGAGDRRRGRYRWARRAAAAQPGSGAAGSAPASATRRRGPADASCVIDEHTGCSCRQAAATRPATGPARPLRHIGKALTEAESAGKRVYACADGGLRGDAHDRQFVRRRDALHGFHCSDWTYDTSLQAT